MTDHVRTQIRDALATQLTGLTSTGTRVFKRRVRPLALTDLPCLLIYTDRESVERVTVAHPALEQHDMEIVVAVVALGVETAGGDNSIDAVLDTCMKEVQAAMGASITSGTLSQRVEGGITLQSVDVDLEAGEKTIGEARMVWRAPYQIYENAPDVIA